MESICGKINNEADLGKNNIMKSDVYGTRIITVLHIDWKKLSSLQHVSARETVREIYIDPLKKVIYQ